MSLIATLNHVAQEVASLLGDHPDEDYKVSSSAPALANFALLLAEGNANKYVQVISELYQDNGLMVPDFSRCLEDPENFFNVESFEDDISFMAELEEYHQHKYPLTVFTEEYYALCSIGTADMEDWFDLDESHVIFLEDTEITDDIPVEIASTPMRSCNTFTDTRRRWSLLRHSNLLFDMTIESVPGEVIDTVIQQAEDLNMINLTMNNVSDEPKDTSNQFSMELLFDLTIESLSEEPKDTSDQHAEGLLLYLTIDSALEQSIYTADRYAEEHLFDLTNDSASEESIDTPDQLNEELLFDLTIGSVSEWSIDSVDQTEEDLNPTEVSITNSTCIIDDLFDDTLLATSEHSYLLAPEAPVKPIATSVFGRASPLRIAADFLDMTPRPKSRPAARTRPPTSITVEETGVNTSPTSIFETGTKSAGYLGSVTPVKAQQPPIDHLSMTPMKPRRKSSGYHRRNDARCSSSIPSTTNMPLQLQFNKA